MCLELNIDYILPPGAAVSAKMLCNSGYSETWESSSNVGIGRGSIPWINVQLIVYTFMTGLQFDQLKVRIIRIFLLILFLNIKAFCDRCNILFISSSTYYRFLKKLLYPVIWCYWLMDQTRILAEIMVTFSKL